MNWFFFIPALLMKHSAFVEAQVRVHSDEAPITPQEHATQHSLVEILDGIVILYTIAAHTQLGKVSVVGEG